VKVARFESAETGIQWGVVEGERVIILDRNPLIGPMLRSDHYFPIASVSFLPPTSNPSKVIAMGRNYSSHVTEMGWSADEEPVVFLKPPSSLVGTGEPIRLPRESAHCEAEGELAIIIGRGGRRISSADALHHVFGYSIANDVSARDLMARDGQWARAKGYDTFCPLGPWIDTTFDPSAASITTRIDGEVVQSGNSADMRMGVAEIIAKVSQSFTLDRGDVILTGSPAGRKILAGGMTVSITIEGLATLTNPVIVEDA
jgi:2-keto-4-pentenoate hydratase/2-oxohepta-3-ene-1,7-dioic acid hydratase in catechol pathway